MTSTMQNMRVLMVSSIGMIQNVLFPEMFLNIIISLLTITYLGLKIKEQYKKKK